MLPLETASKTIYSKMTYDTEHKPKSVVL
jgi:hypothetical protein